MEFISRKVFLTKDLVPYDSDGDGVMDSLVLSATTKVLQIPLRQSFDDIGIYEISKEESIEIIDMGGGFDDTIPGDGVTQPGGDVDPQDNNWNGGGSAGVNQDIYYCDDVTALNYQTKTYETVNGVQNIVLTDSNGNKSYYPADSLGTLPTVDVDNTLCNYAGSNTEPGSSGQDTGYNTGQSSGGGIFTLSAWAGCNQSWASYYSTALSTANSYCSTNYGSSTLSSSNFPAGYPQGSCTSTSTAFEEVKLKSYTTTTCCSSYTCGDDNDECCVKTRYRFTYCFYCS